MRKLRSVHLSPLPFCCLNNVGKKMKEFGRKELAFVVLAGGKSLRMGQDKATKKLACLPSSFYEKHDYLTYSKKSPAIFHDLDFLWQSLWRVTKLLPKIPFAEQKIYLSCRADQKEFYQKHIAAYQEIAPDSVAPVKFICDSGTGVCGALTACLEYLQKAIFCLPCDAPFVTENNILTLIDLWQHSTNENIFQYTYVDPVNGRKETLISLYTVKAKDAFCEAMTKKIRVQNSISDEHCLCIPFSGNLRKELFNINTDNDIILYNNTQTTPL